MAGVSPVFFLGQPPTTYNFEFSDRAFTVATMKNLLKSYGQPVSGARAELLARLRDYAADREMWKRCACEGSRILVPPSEY